MKKNKIILVFLFFIIVAVGLYFYLYKDHRDIASEKESYLVSANSIYDEFKKDSTEINTLDGIKIIIDENSWILFRISNTEHVLRISIESTNSKINTLYRNVNERIIKIHDQIK